MPGCGADGVLEALIKFVMREMVRKDAAGERRQNVKDQLLSLPLTFCAPISFTTSTARAKLEPCSKVHLTHCSASLSPSLLQSP